MTALGTRLLTLMVDGVERSAEVATSEVVAGDADSDFVTFANAAAGGSREYGLHLVAVQDAAVDTLFDIMWSAPGSEVPVVVRPYGNVVPSAAQPHYSGTVVVKEPDGPMLGGEADASTTAKFTLDMTWPFTAKPTKVTA